MRGRRARATNQFCNEEEEKKALAGIITFCCSIAYAATAATRLTLAAYAHARLTRAFKFGNAKQKEGRRAENNNERRLGGGGGGDEGWRWWWWWQRGKKARALRVRRTHSLLALRSLARARRAHIQASASRNEEYALARYLSPSRSLARQLHKNEFVIALIIFFI